MLHIGGDKKLVPDFKSIQGWWRVFPFVEVGA